MGRLDDLTIGRLDGRMIGWMDGLGVWMDGLSVHGAFRNGFIQTVLYYSFLSLIPTFFARKKKEKRKRCHRPEDSGVDIAAARIVILFFHSHFSLFSRGKNNKRIITKYKDFC